MKKLLVTLIACFLIAGIPSNNVLAAIDLEVTCYGDPTNCANGNQSSGSINPTGNLDYIPLEPLPGVNYDTEASFGSLLQGIFRILIGLGGLVAVLMLVLGGVAYMTSEAVDKTQRARERITAALWGLLLLISSVLILTTINPQLLRFDFIPGSSGSSPPSSSGGGTNTTQSSIPTLTNGGVSGFGQTNIPTIGGLGDIHMGSTVGWSPETISAACGAQECTLNDSYISVLDALAKAPRPPQEAVDYALNCVKQGVRQGISSEMKAVSGKLVGEPGYIIFVCRQDK